MKQLGLATIGIAAVLALTVAAAQSPRYAHWDAGVTALGDAIANEADAIVIPCPEDWTRRVLETTGVVAACMRLEYQSPTLARLLAETFVRRDARAEWVEPWRERSTLTVRTLKYDGVLYLVGVNAWGTSHSFVIVSYISFVGP